MKYNKLIALALVGVMSLSMLTACGGGDDDYEEDYDNETTIAQDVTDAPAVTDAPDDGGVCSDETWAEHIKYMTVIGQMLSAFNGVESVPEAVVSVNADMESFVDAYQSKTRTDCTEAEMQDVLTNLKAAVGILSDYVNVADDGTITVK